MPIVCQLAAERQTIGQRMAERVAPHDVTRRNTSQHIPPAVPTRRSIFVYRYLPLSSFGMMAGLWVMIWAVIITF